MAADDVIELDAPPVFAVGDKVRAKTAVRNDGSVLGRRIGDVLIERDAVGYVRGIGTFLQRYFIYEVDFIEHRIVVGMRAKELDLLEHYW